MEILLAKAEQAVRTVMTKEVVDKLRPHVDYVTLGVDTKKDRVSTTDNYVAEPHAELVCLLDLRTGAVHWTGKSYPTSQQERQIVRFPDLASHFVTLDDGSVMILGCHDLSMYSPRGQAVAGGWRKEIATQFRSLAALEKPVAVLHHPHTTVKVGTWRQQWTRLAQELPGAVDCIGTGAYSYRDGGWDTRDGLKDVLAATQRGDILNVTVRLSATPSESADA